MEDNQAEGSGQPENKGRIIFYASVGSQDIAYPTDLDLLSDAGRRQKN